MSKKSRSADGVRRSKETDWSAAPAKPADPVAIGGELEAAVVHVLNHLRIEARMSLGTLERLSGLKRQGLSYIEHGTRHPMLLSMICICKALEIAPDVVMKMAADHLAAAHGK
jgi:DNA-binding XRE family transcriptional regulator